MRVRIRDLVQTDVLAGTAAGSTLLHQLLALLAKSTLPAEPTPLYLDFADVEVATTSFLRDGPLEFRRMVRARHSNLYPIIANASPPIVEELQLYLSARGDALLCCDLVGKRPERVGNVRLIGTLEPKQRLTFDLTRKLRHAQAADLSRQFGDEDGVGITAWNNRLAALSAKGILMEVRVGRAKTFRLPLEV